MTGPAEVTAGDRVVVEGAGIIEQTRLVEKRQ